MSNADPLDSFTRGRPELGPLRRTLASMVNMIVELRHGTVPRLQGQIDQLNTEAGQMRVTLQDMKAQIASHDALIWEARDKAAAQKNRIDALEGTVAGQAALIETLEARIATAGRNIEALDARIASVARMI